MLYVISRVGPAGEEFLLPSCFGEAWGTADMPAKAMKFTCASDAELARLELFRPALCSPPVVVPLPGTGHQYVAPAPAPAGPPAPDVPPVDAIRSSLPPNGKAT